MLIPESQQLNNAIFRLIKENIRNLIGIFIVFLIGLSTLIYIYINFGNLYTIAKNFISISISWLFGAFCTGIYYYTMIYLRYFGVVVSGVGYDIPASYCKLPYEYKQIHKTYITINKLNCNGNYYNTTEYYDYCVSQTDIAICTFILAHIYVGICVVPVVFSSFAESIIYPKYVEIIDKLNSNINNYLNNQQTEEYEILQNQKKFKVITQKDFSKISFNLFIFAHSILSIFNYVLRRYIKECNDVINVNIPILLTGMFITEGILFIYTIKNTPFEVILEKENIELV